MKTQEIGKLIEAQRTYMTNYIKYKFTYGDEQLAEDIFQDSVLKALKNKDTFTKGTNFKAWFYIIIRNTYISHYHSKRRQTTEYIPDDIEIMGYQAPSVDSEEFRDEQLLLAERGIEALPDEIGETIKLRMQGFKYEEIAELTNAPVGTVKNRIHVARKFLKEYINFINHDTINPPCESGLLQNTNEKRNFRRS